MRKCIIIRLSQLCFLVTHVRYGSLDPSLQQAPQFFPVVRSVVRPFPPVSRPTYFCLVQMEGVSRCGIWMCQVMETSQASNWPALCACVGMCLASSCVCVCTRYACHVDELVCVTYVCMYGCTYMDVCVGAMWVLWGLSMFK